MKDAGLDELTWEEKTRMLSWLDAYTKRSGGKERTEAEDKAVANFTKWYYNGAIATKVLKDNLQELTKDMHPDDVIFWTNKISERDSDVVYSEVLDAMKNVNDHYDYLINNSKDKPEIKANLVVEKNKAISDLVMNMELKRKSLPEERYKEWVQNDLPKLVKGLTTDERTKLTNTISGETLGGKILESSREEAFKKFTLNIQDGHFPIVDDDNFATYKSYAGDLLKNSKLFEYIMPQVRVTKEGFPVFQVKSKAIFKDDEKRFISIRFDENSKKLYLLYGTEQDPDQWRPSLPLDQYKPIASGSSPSGSSGSNATTALGKQPWETQNPPEDLSKAIDKAKTGKMFSVQVQSRFDPTGMTNETIQVPIYDYQKIQDEAFKKKIKEETKARGRKADDFFLYNDTLFYVGQFMNVPKN